VRLARDVRVPSTEQIVRARAAALQEGRADAA
jgi:hypothetical protein